MTAGQLALGCEPDWSDTGLTDAPPAASLTGEDKPPV